MAETRKFPHHLIREIFEQPEGLRRTIEPRVSLETGSVRLEDVRIAPEELRAVQRINIVASGTSRHAGMAGQSMIQELAGVPVDVDYASEFEYRNPLIGKCEVSIFITQSGETADTTGALREARKRGSRTIAISNVVGSTIAREADGVIYTHAGPEISIASTKAFTAQMVCLFLFAMQLGQIKEKLSQAVSKRYIGDLLALPGQTETVLAATDQVDKLAELYYRVDDFMFLGRAIHYPIAMDGALKLKEISYIHAEGYPTGEAKHGPNALIDYRLPLVMIATHDSDDPGSQLRYDKNVSNMEGFKNQGGTVIALATEGDAKIPQIADHTFFVPRAPELLSPILEIVPLQLFAYYVAAKRGLDVDRPRNLVKAVTRE
ncbi:MAG TPA: isomerizing glutamine--fructose-6-phosphate transaminase [Terriglobales bacterium]|nr:isomerizing glutamine--fructose-6-phosphate transaminase [Terriglobales bacterium]